MKKVITRYIIVLGICFLSSCDKSYEPVTVLENNNQSYAFLGHIYATNNRIDPRLEAMDLSEFDHFWLGGDVCAETTADQSTLEYIDDLFNLSAASTHWALGNHDIRNGNLQWIADATNRPSFYASSFNGITLMILNTNFAYLGNVDTTLINEQFEMIENVCDSITNSSHLIILSHHMVWNPIDLENNTSDIANGDLSDLLFHVEPNLDYTNGIYPLLQEVKSRGVEVMHIAGDLGQKVASYEYETQDGIHYLGSGITAETEWNEQFSTAGDVDYFLILNHDLLAQEISWTYKVVPN